MSKTYLQHMPTIMQAADSACGAGASSSGSLLSTGYARVVGSFFSDASSAGGTGSGLTFFQSADYGAHFDLISASSSVLATCASAFDVAVVGNAVKVKWCNGLTAATSVRYAFMLRPT